MLAQGKNSLQIRGCYRVKKIGIILAGGKGKRIANFANPKVMLRVKNKTLVENHIQGLLEVFNVDVVILVINSEKKELTDHARSLKTKYGEKLIIVEGIGFKKNATKYGIDLIHAYKNLNNGDLYFYVMGDHFIDYDDLKPLKNEINEKINEFYSNVHEKMLIFIDTAPKCAKEASQSKVLIRNDEIMDHGKELENWNALETGLIIIKPEVLSKLEAKLDELRDFDTTNIVNMVKKELNDAVTFFDIKGTCWFGVNTFDDWMDGINNYVKYRLTLKETITICKAGKAGIFAHLLYKYIAAIITFIILKLNPRTRAESVSIATYVMAIPATIIAFFYPLLGAIIYLFLEILDSVDGTIARLKNTCNIGGGLLDSGAGVLRHTLIPLAIFIHYKLYILALAIALLQAMKYRLRWHMAEAGAHIRGFVARMLEKRKMKIIFGLTGDVIVTLILGALILEYFGIIVTIPPLLPFYWKTISMSPIQLTAYFFAAIYAIMGFLDVIRLPKAALRIYRENIRRVRKNI